MLRKLVVKVVRLLPAVASQGYQWLRRYEKWRAFAGEWGEESVRQSSYYTGEAAKPFRQIKAEIRQLYMSGRGQGTPRATFCDYMIYGLDRQGTNPHDYLFGDEFRPLLNSTKPSYANMLNNKIFTLVYLSARGIPVSRILGQVDTAGVYHSMDESTVADFHDWMRQQQDEVFCKQPDGYEGNSCFALCCREGVYYMNGCVVTREKLDVLLPHLQVETVIKQHAAMAAIYPGSVNTCRAITICKEGEVTLFAAYCLFGCGGARISNGSAGGIFVPVADESGRLGEWGVRELPFGGGRFESHPDTGVRFADCVVPDYAAAMQLLKKAHLTMPGIRSIGWDVAFTPAGPIIIEANQGWGEIGSQVFMGGMRKRATAALS